MFHQVFYSIMPRWQVYFLVTLDCDRNKQCYRSGPTDYYKLSYTIRYFDMLISPLKLRMVTRSSTMILITI